MRRAGAESEKPTGRSDHSTDIKCRAGKENACYKLPDPSGNSPWTGGFG